MTDRAEGAAIEQAFRREDMTIPAPVLEGGNDPLRAPGMVGYGLSFGQVDGERLVDDQMDTGVEDDVGLGGVDIVGRADDGQVESPAVQRRLQVGKDRDIGPVRQDFVAAAGHDPGQVQAVRGPDQGSMDDLAGHAVADKEDVKHS